MSRVWIARYYRALLAEENEWIRIDMTIKNRSESLATIAHNQSLIAKIDQQLSTILS